ncbi:MAG: hypothetical protein PHO18_01400, partial [Synergistaceae bacterium]|nr:hypothetical protein [Synergistaceae bacterium]
MEIISVAVPGPWWTGLSYMHTDVLPYGARVRVPLGRSSRIGLTVEDHSEVKRPEKLKEIIELIDKTPPLPDELWRTICWFSKTWFVSTGIAAKSFLPAQFFRGEELEETLYEPAGLSSAVKYV